MRDDLSTRGARAVVLHLTPATSGPVEALLSVEPILRSALVLMHVPVAIAALAAAGCARDVTPWLRTSSSTVRKSKRGDPDP
jgi:hypothetical protein